MSVLQVDASLFKKGGGHNPQEKVFNVVPISEKRFWFFVVALLVKKTKYKKIMGKPTVINSNIKISTFFLINVFYSASTM